MEIQKPVQKGFTLNLSKFLQARFNVALFRILPFSASRLYMTMLGRIYYSLKKKEKQLIVDTIEHVYSEKHSRRDVRRCTREVFNGIIAHYHEKLVIAYSNYPRLRKRFHKWVDVSGETEFKKMVDSGKGVILVTAHYGGVEWLPASLAARGYPVTMILRFQTQKLKASLERRASLHNDLQLVDVNEGNALFKAMQALKEGRILITECDEFEEWRPCSSIPVSFLNQDMDGDRTLDFIRKRSGSMVVSALMHRHSSRRFEMKLQTLISDDKDKRPVGQVAMEVLNRALSESPEQWYQWKEFGKKLELDRPAKNKDERPARA